MAGLLRLQTTRRDYGCAAGSNHGPLPQTLQPSPPPPAPLFAHPRLGPRPIPTYPAPPPAFVLALALDPWSLLLPRICYARAAAAA